MNKTSVVNFLIALRCLGYAAASLGLVLAVGTLAAGMLRGAGGIPGLDGLPGGLFAHFAGMLCIPGALLAILSRLTEFFVRRARFEIHP